MIKFRRETNRRTEAYSIDIGYNRLYISYEAIVAFTDSAMNSSCRIENHWGPTTGRHMREMGVHDFPIVSDEEMERRIDSAICHYALGKLNLPGLARAA